MVKEEETQKRQGKREIKEMDSRIEREQERDRAGEGQSRRGTG